MNLLKTKRLNLRPIRFEDASSMLPYFSDENTCRYIPWEPRDLDGVIAFLDKWANGSLPTESGSSLILGIELVGTGLIGQLNMSLASKEHGHAEIGYVLNPAFTGNGYATEAVVGLIDYLEKSLDLHRITAYVDERNAASIKLLEALGFRLEARLVENEFAKGEWVTMLIFAMLTSDWAQARSAASR